jgi:hypothetical protein
MSNPKTSTQMQETSYVEPALEVSGHDPLATDFASFSKDDSSQTICGCCFC